jgi:hypothetical protein
MADASANEQVQAEDKLDLASELQIEVAKAQQRDEKARQVHAHTQQALIAQLDGLSAAAFEEKLKQALRHWRSVRRQRIIKLVTLPLLLVAMMPVVHRVRVLVASSVLTFEEKALVVVAVLLAFCTLIVSFLGALVLEKPEWSQDVRNLARKGRDFARELTALKNNLYRQPELDSEALKDTFRDYLSKKSNWLDPEFLEQVFLLKSRDWTESERVRLRSYIAKLPTPEIARDPRHLK